MSAEKTLFITGVSSGFGQALAKKVLAQGHRVIGTVRSESSLATFEALSPERAHGVVLDVTDFDVIDAVFAAVEDQHGPVDVLVNNAGYGHEGIFEESSLAQMRRQFDVNVFGAVWWMKRTCVAGTDNPVALRVITLTDTGKSGRRIRQCSDYLFLDFLFIQASPEMLEVAALGVE